MFTKVFSPAVRAIPIARLRMFFRRAITAASANGAVIRRRIQIAGVRALDMCLLYYTSMTRLFERRERDIRRATTDLHYGNAPLTDSGWLDVAAAAVALYVHANCGRMSRVAITARIYAGDGLIELE